MLCEQGRKKEEVVGERKEEEDECWERKGGIYRISLVGSGSRGKFRFWPGKIGGREPNSKHQPLRHSLPPSTPFQKEPFRIILHTASLP